MEPLTLSAWRRECRKGHFVLDTIQEDGEMQSGEPECTPPYFAARPRILLTASSPRPLLRRATWCRHLYEHHRYARKYRVLAEFSTQWIHAQASIVCGLLSPSLLHGSVHPRCLRINYCIDGHHEALAAFLLEHVLATMQSNAPERGVNPIKHQALSRSQNMSQKQ